MLRKRLPNMLRKRKRLSAASAGKSINDLPVEVIGLILSHVGCVLDVARASMTCRKWRDAVKYHLDKITCDFRTLKPRNWEKYELSITRVVKQTTCLRELFIHGGRIHSAFLSAWLRHTRKTLKSFSLSLRGVTPRLNVLKKMADVKSSVEHFVWIYECVPRLDVHSIHILPSLVSLNIDGTAASGMHTVKDIKLLFSLSPRLEIVSLTGIKVTNESNTVMLNLPSSLRTLKLNGLSFTPHYFGDPQDSTLVLHAETLSYLSLSRLSNRSGLLSVEVDQMKSLQNLQIRHFRILRLQLGGSLQNLLIWGANIKHLEVPRSLASLLELKLFMGSGSRAIWPMYSRIFHKASTKLSRMQLLGGLPTFTVEDLDAIARSFPRLSSMSLYHQDTLFGKLSKKLRVFRQLVEFEVYVTNKFTDHCRFAGWIAEFLKFCPRLKRLVINLEPRAKISWEEEREFPDKLESLLKELMLPYSHVDLVCHTVKDKELLEIFSPD